MAEPLQVTVFDPETGETSTGAIEPGSYMLICLTPCYLHNTTAHANGTTVLTIKGRASNLMGIKEVSS
ncbi:MAG TPA: hypothetical protein DGT23_32390 [Micromonosporaceae bacterium]|nr:hypothetical protein [Micromonosporaceae bacterium]